MADISTRHQPLCRSAMKNYEPSALFSLQRSQDGLFAATAARLRHRRFDVLSWNKLEECLGFDMFDQFGPVVAYRSYGRIHPVMLQSSGGSGMHEVHSLQRT